MTGFRFTPQAALDLREIYSYIAKDNPSAAATVIRVIKIKCEKITEYPQLGRRRDELALGLLSVTAGKYIVFYRPRHTHV